MCEVYEKIINKLEKLRENFFGCSFGAYKEKICMINFRQLDAVENILGDDMIVALVTSDITSIEESGQTYTIFRGMKVPVLLSKNVRSDVGFYDVVYKGNIVISRNIENCQKRYYVHFNVDEYKTYSILRNDV